MEREELISAIGKPLLRPVAFVQIVFIIAMFASPFILIWGGWCIAWRIGLTGLVGMLLSYWVYNIVKKAAANVVDEGLEKIEQGKITKSKFREKLEQMQKESKTK
jgi:hypothetical protein